VDFPLALVSKQAAREKSVRQGHPSTLHLWWARRPLGSERAILLSLLLPDPSDPFCPKDFKKGARAALPPSLANSSGRDQELREALFKFISDFSDWDQSNNPDYIRSARALVRLAYGQESPLVVDPFAGGGSIPLESIRLGCATFASDLSPVACLILKASISSQSKQSSELAREIRKWGTETTTILAEELDALYPKNAKGGQPLAYLWARTIRCESPGCGCEIPLARTFWLGRRGKKGSGIKLIIHGKEEKHPQLQVEVLPASRSNEFAKPTVNRGKATCPACHVTLHRERVQLQLREQRGGADPRLDGKHQRVGGATLLAVVTREKGSGSIEYRPAHPADYEAIDRAIGRLKKLRSLKTPWGDSLIPDEVREASAADRVIPYGMTKFTDLFTARQTVALSALCSRIIALKDENLRLLASMILGRCIDYWTAEALWAREGEFVAHTFGLQVIPIGWDFAETVPFRDGSGAFPGAVEWVAKVVENLPRSNEFKDVQLADAASHPLPSASACVWFTDPPYYDAVRYAALSDIFYVWERRALGPDLLPRDPFEATNRLTPKAREAVEDEAVLVQGRRKDRSFFEKAMAAAFVEGRRVLRDDGIGCVVFAHKTTEGWEALLSGIIDAGLEVTASWPIATERPGRLRSQNSAALSTSIHLVCRPRASEASVGDWSTVARELPLRVRDSLSRLGQEGIRGADLVFSCIGPAMQVYSRYARVVDAQDKQIPLGGDPASSDPSVQGYLAKVWEVVGRLALEEVLGSGEGGAASLEEDARLTALFLWTLQASQESAEDGTAACDVPEMATSGADLQGADRGPAGLTLVYDVVRRFAQPLGIHLETWEGRIVETADGVVRLLPVSERLSQLFDRRDSDMLASTWDGRGKGRQTTLFQDQEREYGSSTSCGSPPRSNPNDYVRPGEAQPTETTLDRVHKAMLLQAGGATGPLQDLLKDEKRRGSGFELMVRALAALYPRGSEDLRLIEALALAIPK
jgi:putative DNA methylase